MKRSLIIAGLLALCSVAAFAAPVKTSKAVPLNETQMEAVKGQALLYVYYWNGSSYVTAIEAQNIGYTGYAYQIVHSGGPQNAVEYIGVEYPPNFGSNPEFWVTAYPGGYIIVPPYHP